MDNTDIQVLRQVAAWTALGQRAILATVTRTWGSAPRPVGSLLAINGNGQLAGSVSGGCIEDDLIERVREGDLKPGTPAVRPAVIRYGVDGDQAARFGLPCGGTVELVVETVGARSEIEALLQRLADGRIVRRTLSMTDGSVALSESPAALAVDVVALDERALTTMHGPQWRVLIIGAGQMTLYLAQMSVALGYQVTVCDPRVEYVGGFDVRGATLVQTMPDDAVVEFKADKHSAIIALSHDPKLDDLALLEALRSDAFYIGAIGSYANQARRRLRLAEHFELGPAQLARLHGPVGIKNGARTPPEIAVAILAELTAVRYGFTIPEILRPASTRASLNDAAIDTEPVVAAGR